MPAPRKVLFISADQWRAECLSAVGHPLVKTPHLDALARRWRVVQAPFHGHRAVRPGALQPADRAVPDEPPLRAATARRWTARHTNIAQEVRKAGMDPMLFGYTDTSADPRGLRSAGSGAAHLRGAAAGLPRRPAVPGLHGGLDERPARQGLRASKAGTTSTSRARVSTSRRTGATASFRRCTRPRTATRTSWPTGSSNGWATTARTTGSCTACSCARTRR